MAPEAADRAREARLCLGHQVRLQGELIGLIQIE
jgi:hypothetical protein